MKWSKQHEPDGPDRSGQKTRVLVSDRLTGDFQSILSFFRLILPDINICPNNLPRDPGLSAFRGSKDESFFFFHLF